VHFGGWTRADILLEIPAMNPRLALLAVTLIANCVFAALLLRPSSGPAAASPSPAAGPAAIPAPAAKPADTRDRPPAEAGTSAPPAPAAPAFNWASIESADFKQYIQNLRDLGVPEPTIRDLIQAELAKLYRPKFRALRPPANPEKYWERNYGSFGPFGTQSTAQRQQEAALRKEQSELLRTLLGDPPASTNSPLARLFPDASPEVLKQFSELQSKMSEKQQALRDKTGGYYDGSSMTERRKIEREFHDELAKLVPPEQLEAYKLRNSETARNLRDELRAFAPTEEEFKAIFRQRDTLGNPRDGVSSASTGGPMTAELARQMRERQLQAEAALTEALGPERAKEYKALSGYEFSQLAEAGIPRESLLRLAEMKTSAEQAVANLRKDSALSAEQRAAAQQAIRAETEKELATLLGERRAKAYPNSGGYWIQNLAPTPPTITRVATP
jgi:hypothetical protein